MRKLLAAVIFFAAAPIATTAVACAGGFSVSANALHEGGPIPRLYVYDGCNGLNRSPELSWSSPPAGSKSFAVTVFDPDVPGGWWHWVLYDIPATTRGLPENASAKALPQNAKQTHNDFGTSGYGGPCPPPGKAHRYVFTVYALKAAQLAVTANGPPAKTAEAIRRNALTSATLTARYGR